MANVNEICIGISSSFFKNPVRKKTCCQVVSKGEKITVFFFNNLVHVIDFILRACVRACMCGTDP